MSDRKNLWGKWRNWLDKNPPTFLCGSVIHDPEKLAQLNERYGPGDVETALVLLAKQNMSQTFDDVEQLLAGGN